jgi:hypothetical protein
MVNLKKPVFVMCAILIFMFSAMWMDAVLHDDRTSPRRGDEALALPESFISLICNAPPARQLGFTLSQSSAGPGDCISVYIEHAKKPGQFTVTAPFYEKPIAFFPYGDGYVGLVPIYAWLIPGDYPIRVKDLLAHTESTLIVRILPKSFDAQYLWVTESIAALRTDDNEAKDQAYFDAARSHPIPRKLWEGPFIRPAEGWITTSYNSMRYTNGNPVPTRHLAIDIANAEGTPVLASNNGRVVLARKLILPGNSVVIDHGMGIYTSSLHLSEIAVKEGMDVMKGDVIGKMGSTGYSSGPHLHFVVWKEGTFLDPGFFFTTDPVAFPR